MSSCKHSFFFMLNSAELEILTAYKYQNFKLKSSATKCDILTFMSKINLMLSQDEHENIL